MDSMHLVSVNIGSAATIAHGNKTISTGICKYPVAGPVEVGELGIEGDVIVNLEQHGGADQAVYAYSADDYVWWAQQTGEDYPPGRFGENLTILGMPSNMSIGDRLLLGEVVLEATSPRIPCATLAIRMNDSGFGLAFRKAERPGIYFRVLNPGTVSAGDAVSYVASEDSDVSVMDLFHFKYARRHDPVRLRRFLKAPIAVRFREQILQKLD